MTFEELSAEMQKALTEFRATVDRELKEIKASGTSAPETKESLDRLNKRIDELQIKMERPPAGNTEDPAKGNPEYHKAFNRFTRSGDESGVSKAAGDNMNVGSNSGSDGGYAVPVELDRSIYALQLNVSPIRGIANVVSVGGPNYQKIVNLHGTTSGWVGESDTRAATKSPTFAKLTPYMGELYAFPQTTQQLLDDAMFDVEQFLASELSDKFAIDEGTAFVSGNGTNQPKGFLGYTMASTADGTRAFGQVQYVKSGANGAFATNNPTDAIVDLIYTLKAAHRQGARFVTNKAVLALMRKFKDGDGNSLWAATAQAGQPSTFMGYPVTEAEDMPAVAQDSYSLAYGNFQRGYTIVDRIGTRVLRDPFTNKPYVGFYATRRVGGFLADSEAIKVMKFAA